MSQSKLRKDEIMDLENGHLDDVSCQTLNRKRHLDTAGHTEVLQVGSDVIDCSKKRRHDLDEFPDSDATGCLQKNTGTSLLLPSDGSGHQSLLERASPQITVEKKQNSGTPSEVLPVEDWSSSWGKQNTLLPMNNHLQTVQNCANASEASGSTRIVHTLGTFDDDSSPALSSCSRSPLFGGPDVTMKGLDLGSDDAWTTGAYDTCFGMVCTSQMLIMRLTIWIRSIQLLPNRSLMM